MLRRAFCGLSVLTLSGIDEAAASEELLPPELAFKMALGQVTVETVQVKFLSAPGYYLYADRFAFEPEGSHVQVAGVRLPPGEKKFESAFDREVTFFRGLIVVTLKLNGPAVPFNLMVRAQGCADAGVCYPPIQRTFAVARRAS